MKVLLLLVSAFVFSTSCQSTYAPPPSKLDVLTDFMTGSFSSADQAESQSSYFPIRLEMHPIWQQRDDGPWLYVEQAVEDTLDKPYRQRVYQLAMDQGRLSSAIFGLPGEAADFVGGHRRPEIFESISPEDLNPMPGCTVHMQHNPARGFVGSTNGTDCQSTLRGAAYVTSIVEVSDGLISSWDRGFDATGEQVWGAVDGPYLFRRIETAEE